MAMDRGDYRVGRCLAATSRPLGFMVVTVTYLAAGAAAWVVSAAVPDQHPLLDTLWADLGATAVVFAMAMAVGNSSLYDPYWSVAPAVIVVAWAIWRSGADVTALSARQSAVIALVLIWAARLTANWALSWRGLGHEDWRYVQIRAQTPRRLPWWLVSLAGIQVMPTLVVFAGLLAVWPAVTVVAPLGPLDAVAVTVTATAIVIEAVADWQLRRFARDPAHRARVADRGLWRYSRHPNYLGEIGFWWGMWLFGLAATPAWWWTVIGPIAMVLLFTFVSVPMMDRRSLERRPAYAVHMRRVPALFPSLRATRPGRARATADTALGEVE
jgi:steroid 5-alpha reductase family enzyme